MINAVDVDDYYVTKVTNTLAGYIRREGKLFYSNPIDVVRCDNPIAIENRLFKESYPHDNSKLIETVNRILNAKGSIIVPDANERSFVDAIRLLAIQESYKFVSIKLVEQPVEHETLTNCESDYIFNCHTFSKVQTSSMLKQILIQQNVI